MPEPVIFIAHFRISDPDAWRPAIAVMADFVSRNVPRVRSFHAYNDSSGMEGTVIYIHPDAESLDQHLEVAAEMIRAGSRLVEEVRVEVLGPAHEGTIDGLRASGTPVVARPRHVAGFDL